MVARVLAAFVLGPPFLYVLWYGGWPLAILFSAISGIASWEMVKMEQKGETGPRMLLTIPWAAAFPLVYHWKGLEGGAILLAAVLPLVVLPAIKRGETEGEGRAAAFTVLAVVLCGFLLGFTVLLRTSFPDGQGLILVLVGLVWAQDTGAYFIGTAIGKHKLSKLSPKKSWEGTIAGLIVGVAVAYAMAHFLGVKTTPVHLFVLALAFAGIAGQLGDLFESLIKRDAGVKDSGHLIPGHGGLLDRFDSMCSAAPILYFFLKVLPLSK